MDALTWLLIGLGAVAGVLLLLDATVYPMPRVRRVRGALFGFFLLGAGLLGGRTIERTRGSTATHSPEHGLADAPAPPPPPAERYDYEGTLDETEVERERDVEVDTDGDAGTRWRDL